MFKISAAPCLSASVRCHERATESIPLVDYIVGHRCRPRQSDGGGYSHISTVPASRRLWCSTAGRVTSLGSGFTSYVCSRRHSRYRSIEKRATSCFYSRCICPFAHTVFLCRLGDEICCRH